MQQQRHLLFTWLADEARSPGDGEDLDKVSGIAGNAYFALAAAAHDLPQILVRERNRPDLDLAVEDDDGPVTRHLVRRGCLFGLYWAAARSVPRSRGRHIALW